MNLTHRKKIILAFLIPILFASITITIFLYYTLLNYKIKHWASNNKYLMHTLKNSVLDQVDLNIKLLTLASKQKAFERLEDIDKVDRKINGIPENLGLNKKRIFSMLKNDMKGFSVLFLLTPNGDHYISYPYNIQKNLKKFNLSSRAYFQEAKRTKKLVISNGFLGADGVPAIAMDLPILDKEKNIIAHLGGVLYLNKISELLRPEIIYPFDAGFIIDSKAYLLAHSDHKYLTEENRKKFSNNNIVKKYLSYKKNKNDGILNFQTKQDNKKHIVFSSKLENGWTIVLTREKSSIIKEISVQIYSIMLLVFLMLLAIASIGIFIANRISKKWEIAEANLHKTHHQLEDRVYERTKDLQKFKNYFYNIIDSMPSIIIGLDSNLRITHWNKTAELRTDIFKSAAINTLITEFIPELDINVDDIRESIKNKEIKFLHKHIYKLENEKVYEDITIYPLIGEGLEGVVIRIDDITKEHKLEEELNHRSKMDAIGQLAGGVAHDFNNIIGGIIGIADILKIELSEMEYQNVEMVDMIIKVSKRASNLTSKLLAFGRKDSIVSTSIDIHKIIDDTVLIFNRTINKKIKIKIKKNAKNKFIIGDNSTIQSSIMNLGINSSHAMPKGGTLLIETKNLTLNQEDCDNSSFSITPGEYIEIKISDTGTGISPNNLKKIFEPFFTTKELGKGTGLGLSVVYGTIQEHKGSIIVTSEENIGTSFSILLPNSDEVKKENSSSKKGTLEAGNATILLVDDEEILRVTGKYMLKKLGYNVILASNGLEALEYFKKEHKNIDIVMTDMIMPEMNGRETFLKMKEIDHNCKVIISSGFMKTESIDELKEMGLSGFIEKPYRGFELSNLLTEVLSKK